MTRKVRKIIREKETEGKCKITIKKFKGNFKSEQDALAIWTLVCGGSETAFDNSNAHIGIGDGTTAEDASQTGLQGTNKTYLPMDSGYPQYGSDQKAVFKATADGNTANHGWQEFTVANGNSDTAKNLNRKVSDKGTKPSGETWVIQVELSLS